MQEDTFWVYDWRKQLCLCSRCKQTYSSFGVTFLIEEFEDESEDNPIPNTDTSTSSTPKRPFKLLLEESAEQAFLQDSNINYESKLNVIYGYNEMSEKLKAYLDTFAKTGKVVTKEV